MVNFQKISVLLPFLSGLLIPSPIIASHSSSEDFIEKFRSGLHITSTNEDVSLALALQAQEQEEAERRAKERAKQQNEDASLALILGEQIGKENKSKEDDRSIALALKLQKQEKCSSALYSSKHPDLKKEDEDTLKSLCSEIIKNQESDVHKFNTLVVKAYLPRLESIEQRLIKSRSDLSFSYIQGEIQSILSQGSFDSELRLQVNTALTKMIPYFQLTTEPESGANVPVIFSRVWGLASRSNNSKENQFYVFFSLV